MVGASPQNTARATTALSIFFVLFATCTEVGADLRYEVVRDVIDGDTIVLQSGERVRLAGINTPELRRGEQLHEPLAKEASSTLLDLIGGQLVGLEEAEIRLITMAAPWPIFTTVLVRVFSDNCS